MRPETNGQGYFFQQEYVLPEIADAEPFSLTREEVGSFTCQWHAGRRVPWEALGNRALKPAQSQRV